MAQGPEWASPLGWSFTAKSAAWLSQKSGPPTVVLDIISTVQIAGRVSEEIRAVLEVPKADVAMPAQNTPDARSAALVTTGVVVI